MADLGDRIASQEFIVKADEVDTGTALHSPGRQLPLSALSPVDGSTAAAVQFGPSRPIPKPLARPTLRRDGSAPPPPSQPPPAAPLQHPDLSNATDSLSLPQLKQLVQQFPKIEQRAYAFQYADDQPFEEELDEWFAYSVHDRTLVLNSREAFELQWKRFSKSHQEALAGSDKENPDEEPSWIDVSQQAREQFFRWLAPSLSSRQAGAKLASLESLMYIVSGVWGLTAGLPEEQNVHDDASLDSNSPLEQTQIQVQWMHSGASLLASSRVLKALHDCTVHALARVRDAEKVDLDGGDIESTEEALAREQELLIILTIWYLLGQSARSRGDSDDGLMIRKAIKSLKPGVLSILVETMAVARWSDHPALPLSHLVHLFWKLLLILFGDTKHDLNLAKEILQPEDKADSKGGPLPTLTASPLDYHLFRQEITSKYPAYNPPLPLVPLEIDHKSMLPPVPHPTGRTPAMNGTMAAFGAPMGSTGGSILHQPVHIATPAPSPPPSPVGPGGKAGKKQNYQTNQNFPFLYPPLDNTSNNIGGKGSTEMQDFMVGKKWEGSDIPASIIEAGQLFASRMRMTRGMRQLWRERELFLKHDRGWNGKKYPDSNDAAGSEEKSAEDELADKDEPDEEDTALLQDEPDLRDRLETVENFYHDTLPLLQSLVIVLMKVMVKNVQDIAIQNGSLQENGQSNMLPRNKSNSNMNQTQNLPMPPPPPQVSDLNVEDLDMIRSREINQKALAGSIFLLLKWFKLSHILKFEYFTQLLLDSNYIPIALKYFAHQNLEDMVAIDYSRRDQSFFHFCHLNSDHPPLPPASPQPSSSQASSPDSAAPPPIARHRRSPTLHAEPTLPRHLQTASPSHLDDPSTPSSPPNPPTLQAHPSVDELGNPISPLPPTPLTTFSPRQFTTSIHLLRTLQKLTRSKSHRILLLVQYKSSQVLRRILRVPDATLRLYTLKLFKSQVPYCGRKWRQSNMRVITAIYLHCRPELRDDWLAGMHDTNVEGEVDEAVPLEWALRGLTFWWQRRCYGDVLRSGEIGGGQGGVVVEDEERDFFQRELDAMGWGLAAQQGQGEEVAFGEEAPGAVNGGGGSEQWEQSGSLNMEGW